MPWLRTLLAFGLLAGTAAAADWPQFLGPNRDGSTSEEVAPWKGELKIVWRQPVGEGHSSPVVADGVVYLHFKLANQDAEALQAKRNREAYLEALKKGDDAVTAKKYADAVSQYQAAMKLFHSRPKRS